MNKHYRGLAWLTILLYALIPASQGLAAWYDSYGFAARGCIAYWPMDSNALDKSGNSLGGVVSGATVTAGKFNNGYNFNGTSSKITIANDIQHPANLTLAAWIKVTAYPAAGKQGCIFNRRANGNELSLRLNTNGTLTFYSGLTATSDYAFRATAPTTKVVPKDGAWHLVVGTFDGTNAKIYLDGTAIVTATATHAMSWTSTFQSNLIGASGNTSGDYFSGGIDEVAIFNRALTAADVTLLRQDTSTANTEADFWECSLKITAPAAGAKFFKGEANTITWTALNGGSTVKLDYSTNAGSTWTTIKASNANVNGTNTYSWTPTITATSVLVRVTSIASPSLSGVSGTCAIAARSLTLTAPAAGAVVYTNGTNNATWTSADAGTTVKVNVSYDGGTTWAVVNASAANTQGANTFAWTPTQASTNCKLQVVSNSYPAVSATSPAFTVKARSLVFTAPAAGAAWMKDEIQSIKWTSTDAGSTVKLQVSYDNGVTWTTLRVSAPNIQGANTYNWTPLQTAATCRLRISSVTYPTLIVDSPAFSIDARTITVSTPAAGAALFQGDPATITWTARNAGTTAKIEYSDDNGASWELLTASVAQVSGTNTYRWTPIVGYITQGLIRVTSRSYPAATGTSGKFRIDGPTLTLSSPLADDVWFAGGTVPINWTSFRVGIAVTAEVSTNGGADWRFVAETGTNHDGGNALVWTPEEADISDQCLIRVFSNADQSVRNTSGLFKVVKQSITLDTPQGGAKLYLGEPCNVTWTTQYINSSTVNLELSTDNGETWETLVPDVPNQEGANSYSWTPAITAPDCLLRISDTPTLYGVTAEPISILARTLTLTGPANGARLYRGEQTYIVWNSANIDGSVKIDLSADGGVTWSSINGRVANKDGANSIFWTPALTGTNFKVRVTSLSYPKYVGVNSAPFTVTARDLTLTSPAGGATIFKNEAATIGWTSNYAGSAVKLEVSYNGGTAWNTLVASTPCAQGANSYSWTPTVTGTNCLLRVSSVTYPAIIEVSAAPFTIAARSITLFQPGDGYTVFKGEVTPIKWDSANAGSTVKIELSANGGSTWTSLAASFANIQGTNTYNWTPTSTGTNFKVRVTSNAYPAISDVNTAAFSVAARSLSVTAPASGGVLFKGEATTIMWTSVYGGSSVKIELSTDSGSTWTTLVASVLNNEGVNTYSPWTPVTISNTCKIRITSNPNPTISGLSSGVFTVTTRSIGVTAPIGGATVYKGEATAIGWTSNYAGTTAKIELSADGGLSWSTLAASVANAQGANTYTWTPAATGTNFKVRVTSLTYPAATGTSGVFTVGTRTLSVTAPTSGATLYKSETASIGWTSSNAGATVKLELSADGGSTWSSLAASVTNNPGANTYSWTPAASGTNFKVRVTSVSYPTITSTSAAFSVAARSITLATPADGATLFKGEASTISWTSVGGGATVKIELSANNGSTWSTLAASAANVQGTNSYTWTPTTTGTTFKVRVTAISYPTATDVNATPFTVTTRSLTLNTPADGATLYKGEASNITWTSNYAGATAKIELSTNWGSTWTTLAASVANAQGNNSYSWTPTTSNVGNSMYVRIRVTSLTYPALTDANATDVNIATRSINVTTPADGSMLYTGESTTLAWSAYNAGATVKIEVSDNNGLNWTTVAASIANVQGDNTYTWRPSAVSNPFSSVRITSNNYPSVSGSSRNLTIVTRSIAITAPASPQKAIKGESTLITWNAYYVGNTVKIDLSVDGGVTWTPIAASVNCTQGSNSYGWIPAQTSLNAKLRITSLTYPAVVGVQASSFAIETRSITMTQPLASGVLVKNESGAIAWKSNNAGATVKIEASYNGGSTWTTLSAAAPNIEGDNTFNWTPSTVSANCRVRVTALSYPAATGTSASFSIITATLSDVAAGGTNLVRGVPTTISWVSSSAGTTVKLELSYDDGVNWATLGSNIANIEGNNSYNWTPPQNGDRMRIRVTSTRYPVVDAISAWIFVKDRSLTVTNPISSYIGHPGELVTINWTAFAVGSTVKLDYSLDNGANWSPILASTANRDGVNSYNWRPTQAGDTVKVRVTSLDYPTVTGANSGTFAISVRRNVVTAPAVGATLLKDEATTIRWTNYDAGNPVNIELSNDGGTTWSTLASNYDCYANGYVYNWTPSVTTVNAKIRISSIAYPSAPGTSGAFTVTARTIAITAPTASSVGITGELLAIAWTANQAGATVKIDSSRDGGATWSPIIASVASVQGANTYNWRPAQTSANAMVRVTSLTYPAVSGSSAVFNVSYRSISTGMPSRIFTGEPVTITWTSHNAGNFVYIDMSVNNGGSFATVAGGIPNVEGTNSYSWTPPTAYVGCRLTVHSSTYSNIYMQSGLFDIDTRSLTFTAPTSEGLTATEGTYITWNSNYAGNFLRLDLSLDGGVTWSYLGGVNTDVDGNKFYWIPNLVSNNAYLRLTSEIYTSVRATSVNFGIGAGALTVTDPASGATLLTGVPSNIKWTSYKVGTPVKIEVSTDGGSSWATVATNITNNPGYNTYSWTPTSAFVSSNARVKISWQDYPSVSGVSAPFSIVDRALSVTAPVQGQMVSKGFATPITWNSTSAGSTVKIELSDNNGTTWTTVAASAPNAEGANTFSWTPADDFSDKCLIRITANDYPTFTALSKLFSLGTRKVELLNPLTNDVVDTSATVPVRWYAYDAGPSVKIQLTTDGFQTISTLADAAPNETTYNAFNWVTPLASSFNCYLFITSNSDSSLKSVVGPFTVGVDPRAINVTVPGPGIDALANNPLDISWSSMALGSTVKIEISYNAGQSWSTIVANAPNVDSISNSFNWMVPDRAATLEGCLIRITSNTYPDISAQSAPFSIIVSAGASAE